jgi:NitT/TauT family transport system permease protein
VYIFLILWTLCTAKFNILKASFFPPPGAVLEQAVRDGASIITNIRTSLGIVVQGYFLALVTAIPLGLFFGWSIRAGNAATYIAKFLGSIPPVVYIPYGIALLPTFRSVSVMVIFLASFWPALAGTMAGVLNVEKQIIDSARSLNVKKIPMLFRIILPASLPQIFTGCNQGLSVSFILLTSAEMIGARSGLGYYVKNFSDLGDYTRSIVGVLVIGMVVTVIVFFFNKLQRYLLRWKN